MGLIQTTLSQGRGKLEADVVFKRTVYREREGWGRVPPAFGESSSCFEYQATKNLPRGQANVCGFNHSYPTNLGLKPSKHIHVHFLLLNYIYILYIYIHKQKKA